MKYMLSLLAFGYVALANPAPSLPVNPGGIGGLFKGPNSETIIKGPDGSVITAAAEGGAIVSKLEPLVAEPVVVAAAPVVETIAAAPVVEAVAIPAAVVDTQQSSDLIGPSGRIATHGSQSIVAGPASTTVTGPAVVAETVVKGPPIIAAPVLSAAAPATIAATAAPLAITGSLVPVSVTPSPLATITAEIAPISVTASPIATVTSAPSPWPVVTSGDVGRTAVVSNGVPLSIVTPSVATVTAAPPVAVTASAPQAVATATASQHLSIASASAAAGASATASISSNGATAAVENAGGIPTVTVTPLPLIPSTVGPIGHVGSLGPLGTTGPVAIDGVQGLGVRLNNRVDLRPQLVQDQLAIDNRQLTLNPIAIPAGHLLPPEIAVTPRVPLGRLGPTPGTILSTPGLGAVASSTNIQREEGDIALSVTPSTLQITPGLTPQQVVAIQTQQQLLNNQIQHAQNAAGPSEAGLAINVTPNTLQINPQVSLTQEQVVALQNQQAAAAAAAGLADGRQVDGRLLFTPSPQDTSLANIQQENLLAAELAKSGIDASQLQLTNVPLSAVTALPGGVVNGNLKAGGINDGLGAEAWGRYGRNVDKEKKTGKKAKGNN